MKFPRAMYSLRTSFCVVPLSSVERAALLLADERVEREQHRRGRVDRHRRRDRVERDAVEDRPHVVDRVDRDAGAADLAEAARVVGVQAQLGRQVERHREARAAVREQVLVARVGLRRRRVAGVLAHRPRPLAVHLAVHAARVREGSGVAELEPLGHVVLRVERLDLDARVGEAPGIVRADDRGDGQALLCRHSARVRRGARQRGPGAVSARRPSRETACGAPRRRRSRSARASCAAPTARSPSTTVRSPRRARARPRRWGAPRGPGAITSVPPRPGVSATVSVASSNVPAVSSRRRSSVSSGCGAW